MGAVARIVDVSRLIDGRRLGAFNYAVIALSWLITLFDGFDMMVIGVTAPYIRDELGLTTAMLGNVFSAGLAGMMLGGFLFSYIGDRVGRRPTILLTAVLFGLLTTGTAYATSYHALLAMRFLDGLALGGMLPLAWALNIEFVPHRMRSTVVTVIMMGYSAGSAAAGPMTNWIAPHHGWQGVYLTGGLGSLCCAVALFMGLPESIRFLVIKVKRVDAVVRTLKRIDPSFDISCADRFVLSDEAQSEGSFRVEQLFSGVLRFLTPLLWVGYLASSLAIYFSASWGPIVLESLQFPRHTSALASSTGTFAGAMAGLLLMRFTDRYGPRCVAIYPAIAAPVLLAIGLGFIPHDDFLTFAVLGALLISGGHFGILSISGIFYPSAIRASGAGWATSVSKLGAILGPIIGAAVLSSGLPIVRSYALLAVCPAILFSCALGITALVRSPVSKGLRRRATDVPARGAKIVNSSLRAAPDRG
jgi:AAHS family 4-hydroxybenzoate transporter-like MFS transporter